MAKDSSIKDIEAGKGIPPIPTSGNGDGTKMETRSGSGLKTMTFSNEKSDNKQNQKL